MLLIDISYRSRTKKSSEIRRDERDYNQGRGFTFTRGFDEVTKPKQVTVTGVQGELSSVNYSSSNISSTDEPGTSGAVGPIPSKSSSFSEEILRLNRGKKKTIGEQEGGVGNTGNIRIGMRSQDKFRK